MHRRHCWRQKAQENHWHPHLTDPEAFQNRPGSFIQQIFIGISSDPATPRRLASGGQRSSRTACRPAGPSGSGHSEGEAWPGDTWGVGGGVGLLQEETAGRECRAEWACPRESGSEWLGAGLEDEWQEMRWKSGQVLCGQVLTGPG